MFVIRKCVKFFIRLEQSDSSWVSLIIKMRLPSKYAFMLSVLLGMSVQTDRVYIQLLVTMLKWG